MAKYKDVVLSKEDGIPSIVVVCDGVPYQFVIILKDDEYRGSAINLQDPTEEVIETTMGTRRIGDCWLSLWNRFMYIKGGRLRAMDDVKQGRDIAKKHGRDVSRW